MEYEDVKIIHEPRQQSRAMALQCGSILFKC